MVQIGEDIKKETLSLSRFQRKIILIAIGIIIIMAGFISFQVNKIGTLKQENKSEVKLRKALLDSVNYYQNKRNEWVAEKLTIQASVKGLEKMNDQLNSMQKDLLKRMKEVEKSNKVIAAALINTSTKIDSFIHGGTTEIDTTKKTINFSDKYKKDNKEVEYSFTVGNVIPAYKLKKPILIIDSLYFPNTQFINFNWKDEKKEGYPISFSITNSNEFFKTVNIESYAIPQVDKNELSPTTWQKFGIFINNKGKTVFYVSLGIAGATGYFLLFQ